MHSCLNAEDSSNERKVGPGRTVLVVDDDLALVEMLSELLRDEGYFVEAYTDVSSALERLKCGTRPDVVLLDYLMPGMTGIDFLLELERDGIDLPVMLFTAMNTSRVHVPRCKVRAVIPKPFEFKRLLEEIAKIEESH